jgi:hypothetical protein
MLGRARLSLLVLLLALGGGSCTTTPTLPLPPPLVSVETPSEGFALIQGQAQALSFVSVLNEASEEGVITRANTEGEFKTRIAAEAGDLLTVWQDLGDGVQSLQKQVTVPAPR